MDDFTTSYRDCYPAVLAYLRRRSNNQVCEDLCAEVFIRAWKGWPPHGRPLPWLYGIAHNVVLEFYRGRERDLADYSVHDADAQSESAEEIVAGPLSILQALATLPEDDQEILRLHTWECLSPSDVALTLGISPATCRVRLHRARRRLTAALAEAEGSQS